MTLKNNRAPLLSNIKLYASFHHHMWIQTGVTVRKRLSWVVTSVTLTFDLWPWPFAWTLRWSLVITPENFMMIRWWEHSQKGVTDRRTDGQTDRRTDRQTENTICRAAWSQLKMLQCYLTTFQITYRTIFFFLALYGLDGQFTHLLYYLFNRKCILPSWPQTYKPHDVINGCYVIFGYPSSHKTDLKCTQNSHKMPKKTPPKCT